MKLVQHFVVVGVPPSEGATKGAAELAAGVLAAFPAPHVLSKSESIPELLPLFCLPEGVHAVPADSEEAQEVRFFTFTLTNSDASRSFGHCCSMMTPIAPDSKQVAPTVLCMLSPLPFPSLFRPFLGLLMRRYIVPLAPDARAAKAGALLRTAAARPEWLIATYCLCAQAPPPGVRVLADYGGHMVAFQRPVAAQAFPTVDAEAWRMLVACLSPENILFLISALLQEQRVLIHSQYFERLQPVCEALSTLIWPLVWAHVYVPVLPLSLLECLTAPCPFIIGVHTSFLETQVGVEALTTSVIVHLDNDKVVTPMEVELPGGAAVDVLPDVPPHAADIFTAQLASLCSTHQVNPLFSADATQPEDDQEAASTSLGAAEAALWSTVGCKLRPANAMPSQASCAVWNQAAGRRLRRASMLSTDSYVQEARRSTVAAVYQALEGSFPSTAPAATQPAPSSRASTGSQSSLARGSDSDASCEDADDEDAEQDSALPVSQFTESWTLAVRAAGAHAICAMLQGYRAFLTVRATLPPLLQQALHAHAIVLANALVAQIVEHAERVRAAEKLANTPLPASVINADEPVQGVTPDARQQELLQAHHGSKLSVSPSSKAQMAALGARFKSKWGAMRQRMAKASAGPLSPAGHASSALDTTSPKPAAPAAAPAATRGGQPPETHSSCRETFAGYARSQAEQAQGSGQTDSVPPVLRIVEQSSRGLNPRVLGQPLDEFIMAALRPSNARAAEQVQSLEEEAQACAVDLAVEFQMGAFLATRPAEARAFIEPLMQSQAVSGWLEEAALCGRFVAAMNTAIDAAAEREVCSFVHQQVSRLASALLQASPGMTEVDVCLPPAELPLAVPIESAFPSLPTLVGLADCVGHGLFVPTHSSDSRASSRRASSVLAVSAVATPSNVGPSTMLRGFGGAKASARSWKLTVSTSAEEADAQGHRPAAPAPTAAAAPAAAPPSAAPSPPAPTPAEGESSPPAHGRSVAMPSPPAALLALVRPVPPIQPAPATEVHHVALDGAAPSSELPPLPLTPMLAALQAVTAEQADLTAIARRVREAARAGSAPQQQQQQQQPPGSDMAAAIGKYTCSADASRIGVPSMDKETLGQVALFDWLMQRCVAAWYARESHRLSAAQEPDAAESRGVSPGSAAGAATPQVGRSNVADMFFTPPTRRSSHARAVRAADMPHQRGASSGDLNSVLTAALGSLSGASSFASSRSASTADDDEPAEGRDGSSDQHSEPDELVAAAGFTGIFQQPQSVARGWADAPTDDFAKFLWVQECAQQASSSGERVVDEQLHEEANSTLVIDVQGAAAELASALGDSLSGPALRESRARVPAEGLPDLLLQPHLLRALSHIEHDEAGEPHILDNADGMDLDDVVEEDSPDMAHLLQVHTPGSRARGATTDSTPRAGAAQMDWIQAAEAARERTATGSITRSDSLGFVRTSSYGLDAMRRASMMSAGPAPPSPSASAGAPASEASSLYTPRSRGNTGSSTELPLPAGDSTPAPVGLSTVRHRRLARRSTLYHTQNPSSMAAARARMEATDTQLSAWWEAGGNWPGADESGDSGLASDAALPASVGSPEAPSASAHQATAGHLPSPRLRARRPSLLVTGSGLPGSRRQTSMLDIAAQIPESESSSGETELVTAPSGLSGGSKPSPAMAPQSPPGAGLRPGAASQSGIPSPALTLGSTSSPEPGLRLALDARSSGSTSSSDEEGGGSALGGGAAVPAAPAARARPQKRQSLTGRLTVPSKAALLEQLGVSAADVLGSSAAQGAKTRRRSSLYLQLQAQGGFRSMRDDIQAPPPAEAAAAAAAAAAFGHAEAQAQGE